MIRQALQERQAAGNPIRVGASGAGWMGSGFVAQMRLVPGMEVVVLADSDTTAAHQAYLDSGIDKDDIMEATDVGPAVDALAKGKRKYDKRETIRRRDENRELDRQRKKYK